MSAPNLPPRNMGTGSIRKIGSAGDHGDDDYHNYLAPAQAIDNVYAESDEKDPAFSAAAADEIYDTIDGNSGRNNSKAVTTTTAETALPGSGEPTVRSRSGSQASGVWRHARWANSRQRKDAGDKQPDASTKGQQENKSLSSQTGDRMTLAGFVDDMESSTEPLPVVGSTSASKHGADTSSAETSINLSTKFYRNASCLEWSRRRWAIAAAIALTFATIIGLMAAVIVLAGRVDSLSKDINALQQQNAQVAQSVTANHEGWQTETSALNATAVTLASDVSNLTAHVLNNIYTKSYLDNHMVFPVQTGATRSFPLPITTFMPNEDHSTNNVAFHDTNYGVFVTSSSLEVYMTIPVPPGWYLSAIYVYGSDSSNDVYVYATRTTTSGGSKWNVCSSTSINRALDCSNGINYMASNYQLLLHVMIGSSDYIYGGYYNIRKAW